MSKLIGCVGCFVLAAASACSGLSGSLSASPSPVPTTSAIEIGGAAVTFVAGAAPPDCPPAKVAGVVLAYFAERHGEHESLRLTKLQIAYGGDRAGLAPTIDRRADDIVPETVSAKGEIDCASGAIIRVWNLGGWGRSPSPVPTGFTLPASCVFVGAATLTPESNEWRIDCGVEANRSVRAVLEPALAQQGWAFCARAATPAWSKYAAGVLTFIQPSPSSTELPRLIAQQQTLANCP